MKEVLYQSKFTSKSFVFRITQGSTFCNNDGSPPAQLCDVPSKLDALQTKDTIQPTHHRVNQGNTFHGDGPPLAFSPANRRPTELVSKQRLGHGDCKESGSRFAAPHMAGGRPKFIPLKKDTPFRSYKHNRPARPHAAPSHDSLDSIYHSNREMNKDSVETSDVATDSSSIALNYRRNLQLLNEKYALKSRRTMSDVPGKEAPNKRASSEMQKSHQPNKDKYFEDYCVVSTGNKTKRNYLTKTNLLNSRDKFRPITQHVLNLNRILPTIPGPHCGFRSPLPTTRNKHFQKTTLYYSSNGKNSAHCQNCGPPRAALRCDHQHKNLGMF